MEKCDICGKMRQSQDMETKHYTLWDTNQDWQVRFCADQGSCRGMADIKVDSRMP